MTRFLRSIARRDDGGQDDAPGFVAAQILVQLA
jgi:hypothetical protein